MTPESMINMSLDEDRVDEHLRRIADHYSATDLVDLLDLSVWDILEQFRDKVLELDNDTLFRR